MMSDLRINSINLFLLSDLLLNIFQLECLFALERTTDVTISILTWPNELRNSPQNCFLWKNSQHGSFYESLRRVCRVETLVPTNSPQILSSENGLAEAFRNQDCLICTGTYFILDTRLQAVTRSRACTSSMFQTWWFQ